jgi:hypothetical protein
LFEHFVFKGGKIFDRKMAIVKNPTITDQQQKQQQ